MIKSIQVEIDDSGQMHSLEPAEQIPAGRALLTWNTADVPEAYLLSEAALAKDWLRLEEDEAWVHLQPAR